ncbi:MAG: dephospho-CoA kinase [Planctomycetota bacterium]|jgi:dephospho-CoA kinase
MDGKPVIVGLLGGIASGKSTVAGLMGSLGAKVIDADEIAHQVLVSPEVAPRLAEIFGPEALDGDGLPDRRAIARAVFADEERLGRLEALVHPGVRERIAAEIVAAGDVPAVVVDAPLLVEGDLAGIADVLVFVDAPERAREARASLSRGWVQEEILAREARQAPLEEKRRLAGHVIENDGSLADLERGVEELFERLVGNSGRQSGT